MELSIFLFFSALVVFDYYGYSAEADTMKMKKKDGDDHYWRDFTGLIPSDAIPGGIDENGRVTYLGVFPGGLSSDLRALPAVIKMGSRIAISTSGGAIVNSTDRDVKILCSNDTPSYQWYDLQHHIPHECQFLPFSRNNKPPYHFGKSKVNKQIVVGKVAVNKVARLIAPMDETVIRLYNYEILFYCSEKNKQPF